MLEKQIDKQSKSALKTTISVGWRLLLCVLIGFLLMYTVYLLPTEQIEQHVANSAELFEKEGAYPSFTFLKYCNSDRDNYTDAWMLLEAAYNGDDTTMNLAMSNYRYNIDEKDPTETIVQHYKYQQDFNKTILYGRYWNGYLVYLKPFLLFLNYSTIRIINSVFQMVLFCTIIFLLVRKQKAYYIAPYILSVLMIMPFAIVLNIQLSTCYTILNIGVIAVLLCEKCLDEKGIFIFLYLGAATSFFDLLSYPLVTFGVPAVFYFCLLKKESIKQSLVRLVKIGLSWCVGYGGMWISKWIIGSLLSNNNLISDGINQTIYRAGSSAENVDSTETFTALETIFRNIKAFLFTPVTIILGIFVLVMLVLIIKRIRETKASLSECLIIVFPYLVLMISPFVWYVLIRNHSAIHFYGLANKELEITAIAISCLCAKLYSELKQKKSAQDKGEVK